jgi:hypothetical protein
MREQKLVLDDFYIAGVAAPSKNGPVPLKPTWPAATPEDEKESLIKRVWGWKMQRRGNGRQSFWWNNPVFETGLVGANEPPIGAFTPVREIDMERADLLSEKEEPCWKSAWNEVQESMSRRNS